MSHLRLRASIHQPDSSRRSIRGPSRNILCSRSDGRGWARPSTHSPGRFALPAAPRPGSPQAQPRAARRGMPQPGSRILAWDAAGGGMCIQPPSDGRPAGSDPSYVPRRGIVATGFRGRNGSPVAPAIMCFPLEAAICRPGESRTVSTSVVWPRRASRLSKGRLRRGQCRELDGIGRPHPFLGAGEDCFRGLYYKVSLALVGVAYAV